ncbi:MAG: hypothetical protein LBM92_00620 [Opitutaceae bacterium]|jgi:hypothetical protein|nr:hypothetical protein [Opitutaceae bacterium]
MKRFCFARICGVFLLCVFFSSGALRAADKWLRVTSEHFEMFSAVSEKQSRQLLVELEQFRAVFLKMIKLRPAHEPRATIVVFKNDRAFRPYLPLYDGTPKELAGYCLWSPGETYIGLSGTHLSDSLGPIFHEYVHALVAPRNPLMPLWINEGMAQVFGTFKVKGDTVEFGRLDPGALAVFVLTPPLPIQELLTVDHDSPHYNEAERAGVFYSQSWIAMHYFMCGSQERGKKFNLGELLSLLESPGVPLSDAMEKGTGLSPDELGQRLADYSHRGVYNVHTLQIPAEPIRKMLRTRPATGFEVEFALMNLKWRVHDAGDTMARLLAMIEKYPGDPRPHEMLAELYARDGQERSAVEHWRHAARLGSENAVVYVMLAQFGVGSVRLAPDHRIPEALCAELRGWLDRAIELSPDYMDAYEALLIVEAFSPEFRPAAVRKATANARYMPKISSRGRMLLASAVVLWRMKKFERSLEFIKALLELPDEPVPPKMRRPGAHNPMEPLRTAARDLEARVKVDLQLAPKPGAANG